MRGSRRLQGRGVGVLGHTGWLVTQHGEGGGGYISWDGMGNHTGTVTKGPTYLIDFKIKLKNSIVMQNYDYWTTVTNK